MEHLSRLMGDIARHLLGEPNKSLSSTNELRYGAKGSLSIDVIKGTFFDHENNEGGGVLELIRRNVSDIEPMDWLSFNGFIESKQRRASNGIGGPYEYEDAQGRKCRKIRTGNPAIPFYWEHLENGQWLKKRGDAQPLLYHMQEILCEVEDDKIIFVFEGEKDVDNARALGVAATCNADGASKNQQKPKWTSEHSAPLRGADVVIGCDNDEAGRAHARAALKHTFGIARRVRFLDIKLLYHGCPDKGDISDWIEQGGTFEELHDFVEKLPDWRPDANGQDNEQSKPHAIMLINIANWDRMPTPEQEWAVQDRIPLRRVCLFSGEGAAGKSLLQLQLSAAHVLIGDWLGVTPREGSALFFDAEDEEEIIHKRLHDILHHYNAKFKDIVGKLHLVSMCGQDSVLGAFSGRAGVVQHTKLYENLLEMVGDLKPTMIGISSSADVFAGNELDRSQVRQFIALLTRLAMTANGAVNLISHPSLTGIITESGISGTTAWHNSVRARIYLKSIGNEENTSLREVVFKKNNYGPISSSLMLKYQDGLFLPVATADGSTSKTEISRIVFVQLLRRFTDQNRIVGDKSGRSYAPALFAEEKEAHDMGCTKDNLATAMRSLLNDGIIIVESYGRVNSRPNYRLIINPAKAQQDNAPPQNEMPF